MNASAWTISANHPRSSPKRRGRTIRTSGIEVGSRVVYTQAADFSALLLDSDVVIDVPGPGHNTAFGHCRFSFATATGLCTFSGGTGTFTHFHGQADGSYLVGGANPNADTYTITAHTKLTGITAVRLEALPDATLASGGPGRAVNGNFVLAAFRLTAAPQHKPADAVSVVFHRATADYSQPQFSVTGLSDAKPTSAWAVHPASNTVKPSSRSWRSRYTRESGSRSARRTALVLIADDAREPRAARTDVLCGGSVPIRPHAAPAATRAAWVTAA